jgi:hypothetical protein
MSRVIHRGRQFGAFPALALLLGGCVQPARDEGGRSAASQPSAAATVERRPIAGGPLFTFPASVIERRASGIEGPVTEYAGPGYKVIFAVSPTISLQGLGIGTVISRAKLALPGASDVVTFVPNPPVEGFTRSIAFVMPLPPGPGIPKGVEVKFLAQALCNTEPACAAAQSIVRSAR